MATINLTYDKFEEVLENNDIVLIDFWADWCRPCKMFAPVFEKASEKYADPKYPKMAFTKVDTEVERQLAAEFGITSIPTLAIFRDKILLFMQPGALPESALEDIIQQVLALDMDEVRQKIEEEKAKEKSANA